MKQPRQVGNSFPLSGLVWGIFVLTLLLDIYAFWLLLPSLGEAQDFGWGFRGFPIIATLPFIVIGTLILNRHPKHMVGWLFSLVGLMSALQGILQAYMVQVFWLEMGNPELGLIVAWVLQWVWMPIVFMIILIPYFFPDGRLPSPRWKFVLIVGAAMLTLFALEMAFTPGLLENSMPTLQNPFALHGFGASFEVAQSVGFVGWLGLFIGAAISLMQRFRRSVGQERQQIKWFLYATILVALAAPVGMSTFFLGQLFFILAMFFLPIATAIAILQHQLWDIDLVIRRTLVYGALTFLLALVYFGSVVALQSLFALISGQGSTIAIVVSTLAIAALFNPLRYRLQAFIDRRFYRRRYDIEKTLGAFNARLRDDLDLETIEQNLVAVVEDTMQPAKTEVWVFKR